VMLAGPVGAQVDWSILGDTGADACPSGLPEIRSGTLAAVSGSLTDTAVQIRSQRITTANMRDWGQTANATPLAAKTTTFGSLTQNTRYALTLHTRSSSSSRHTAARLCFRMATDLTRGIADWGEDNYANSDTAGGCFAFGGTRQQILACLCGARNGNS